MYEVGPRDGLQNELRTLPTRDKVKLIQALIAAGEKRIEVTSFVSPKWIPQLADADQLLRQLERPAGIIFSSLVTNPRRKDYSWRPIGIAHVSTSATLRPPI